MKSIIIIASLLLSAATVFAGETTERCVQADPHADLIETYHYMVKVKSFGPAKSVFVNMDGGNWTECDFDRINGIQAARCPKYKHDETFRGQTVYEFGGNDLLHLNRTRMNCTAI